MRLAQREQNAVWGGLRGWCDHNGGRRHSPEVSQKRVLHFAPALVCLAVVAVGQAKEEPILKPVVCNGHKDLVQSAVFSPSGKIILTASKDSTARLWNLKGEELAVLRAIYLPDADRFGWTVAWEPEVEKPLFRFR